MKRLPRRLSPLGGSRRWALALLPIALLLMAAKPGDGVLTKQDGMTVVNTTTLCTDVRGYKGATPVKIYIKKNKVVRVEALPNKETPKFLARAKKVLDAWTGKSVAKARTQQVDGVTGATFTSKALIKNVQAGLDYYKKNGK